jgi:N-methylhydantoinase A/oxoprolinase/acetone carboxylase beta subunit
MIRLATDIGGTFTDLALQRNGDLFTGKLLTTLDRPEEAVLEGTRALLHRAGVEPSEVDLVIHGTTLATNAIIERKGARTAFVTTSGFTDTIDIGHESRFDQYDLMITRPRPLVPRPLRFGLRERVDVDGNVVAALDNDALEELASFLARVRPESLAVSLLHSYANATHERAVARFVQERFPDISVSLSCDVSPLAGEFERATTTCANAYVRPVVVDYFVRMESRLRAIGIEAPVLIVMSEGGLASIETACEAPVRLVESGPSGGASLAASVARAFAIDKLLSFDMGGTTAKVCIIDDFVPQYDSSFEVDRTYRFQKGSGLPLRIPVVDLVEIGAGGGSIGHLDGMGQIEVGPHSAGSEPGPAAYGLGGDRPTVTDANLVLGKLDPQRFAGGSIVLDRQLAERALANAFAQTLGLEPAQAAAALVEVVDENMANAARMHAIEQGKDISEYTMVAFGGGGPLHAARIAQKIGIRHVIVPPNAGVGSAIGFLAAPAAYTIRRTSYHMLDEAKYDTIASELDSIVSDASLHTARIAAASTPKVAWKALMRYAGQGHHIEVGFEYPFLSGEFRESLAGSFEAEYLRQFGRILPDLPIEIVGWVHRNSLVLSDPADMWRARSANSAKSGVGVASAEAYDLASARYVPAMRFEREALDTGWRGSGPSYLTEEQTTTVIPAGFTCQTDERGFIHLRHSF